jgi:hypothetical protein
MQACATFTTVDGQSVNEATWKEQRAELLNRASFDLGCSPDKLDVTVLDVREKGRVALAGVKGCGLRAAYFSHCHSECEWIMNSKVDESGEGGVENKPPSPQQ